MKTKALPALHELAKARIGLKLFINAITEAYAKYGKEIPEGEIQFIKKMVEAGMEEAERLGLI